MRLDSAGLPFIGGALLVALIVGAAVAWAGAIPFVVLAAFFAVLFPRPPSARPQWRARSCCRRPTAG